MLVLILGQQNDGSTIRVAEWLTYYKINYLIIYTEVPPTIDFVSFTEKQFLIRYNNRLYNLYDVTCVWNRRKGFSPLAFANGYLDDKTNEPFFMLPGDKYHYKQLRDESSKLFGFIHYLIEERSCVVIGSFFHNSVNKLQVLDMAQKVGLNTPETYIVTKRSDLNMLLCGSNKMLITKPICEGVYRPDIKERHVYYSNVERLDKDFISTLPKSFFPSLIQEEIIKKYELRIFFFFDKFYSMAIFSQDNEGAETDFRKNDHANNPLKVVPYNLPSVIEQKLLKLSQNLRINCASYDMIVDMNNEYCFLEVNPVGQLEMTSIPCNYNLDKIIAEALCKQQRTNI